MNFFIFPGQGSQKSGMAKSLVENFPQSKLDFEEASEGASLDLLELCCDADDETLKQTALTQPAILSYSIALWRTLCREGLSEKERRSAIYAGHSLGEYSALVAAEVIKLSDAARVLHKRGQLMQEAVPAGEGGMVALVFKPKTENSVELATEICQKVSDKTGAVLELANKNSAEQIVVSGEQKALSALLGDTWSESIRKKVALPVSAPFHCSLMKPASKKLAPELEALQYKTQKESKYIANVDAQLHPLDDCSGIAERLERQIYSPVAWLETVQTAIQNAAEAAIEVGPGRVLSGLVKRITVEGRSLAARSISSGEDLKKG